MRVGRRRVVRAVRRETRIVAAWRRMVRDSLVRKLILISMKERRTAQNVCKVSRAGKREQLVGRRCGFGYIA